MGSKVIFNVTLGVLVLAFGSGLAFCSASTGLLFRNPYQRGFPGLSGVGFISC